MGIEDRCRRCWGRKVVWSYDRAAGTNREVQCHVCGGSGRERPYRVLPTLGDAVALGFPAGGSPWRRVVPPKCCHGCGKALEGRRTSWCGAKACQWAYWNRLYNGVHWTKRHVIVRDGSACRQCGTVFEAPLFEGGPVYPVPGKLELDHIVPLSDGGTDHADNLQVLCTHCHGIKTAREAGPRARRKRKEVARG